MKIGDFVRFKHAIAVANGGLLNREKAVVVGLDGPLARIVWTDGTPSTIRLTKLVRTEGQIGKTVKAPMTPIKDRGVKPLVAPPRPIVKPLPVDNACWAISDEYVIKGFTPDATPTNPEPTFTMFKVPIVIVEVRGTHWPKGQAIKMSRSVTSLSITHPNGDKKSYTPTGGRVYMEGRFGMAMGTTLAAKLRCAHEDTKPLPVSRDEGITTKVNCRRNYVPTSYTNVKADGAKGRAVDTSSNAPDPNKPYVDDSWKASAEGATVAHKSFSADLDRMMATIA